MEEPRGIKSWEASKVLSAEFRAELARKQIPQSDLVLQTGIKKTRLAEMIAGNRPIYLDEAAKIAKALDLDLPSLMTSLYEQMLSDLLNDVDENVVSIPTQKLSPRLAKVADSQGEEQGKENDEGFFSS